MEAEGFTIKAGMKNSKVCSVHLDYTATANLVYIHNVSILCSIIFYIQVKSPPKAGAFKERPAKPTSFRKFYDRGDFPIALEHDTKGNKIAWKVCC